MTESTSPVPTYQLTVNATWSPIYVTQKATVYASLPGQIPEVVATGTCRLKKHQEPLTVAVPGWEPGCDWDKLNTGMSPGEWVCTPRWVGDETAPVPGAAR